MFRGLKEANCCARGRAHSGMRSGLALPSWPDDAQWLKKKSIELPDIQLGAKEYYICWRQDAALTGTLGSVPPPCGGSHPGCQSMRLPAACSQGRYSIQLRPIQLGRPKPFIIRQHHRGFNLTIGN